MVDSGLAAYVLPEVPQMKLEIDEHHQHKDVYQHSLTVLQQAIDSRRRRSGPRIALGSTASRHRKAGYQA